MTKFLLRVFLAVLGFTAVCKAGPGVSGGGDAIVCDEGTPAERVYLADTFALARSGRLTSFQALDPSYTIESALRILEEDSPLMSFPHPFSKDKKVSFAWMIDYSLNMLNFEPVGNVEELDDDHIDPKSLPKGCYKRQLGVQNLKKMNVKYNYLLFMKLSFAERALFKIHEAFISLRNVPSLDTTPLRKEVAEILRVKNFSFEGIVRTLVAATPFQDIKPPISEVPEKMICRVGGEGQNDFGWKPSGFEVNHTQAGWQIHFARNDGHRRSPAPRAHLITYWDRKDNLALKDALDLGISWESDDGFTTGLFIERYNERLQQLVGSIELDYGAPLGEYSVYTVMCSSPELKFKNH